MSSHTQFCFPRSRLSIDKPHLNFNRTILGSKFECIGQKVEKDLQIAMMIAHHVYEVAKVCFFEDILHTDIFL